MNVMLAYTEFDRPFAAPEMTASPKDVKPFEYKDVGDQIPNYKGNKGGKKGSTLHAQQVPVPAEESMSICRTRPRGGAACRPLEAISDSERTMVWANSSCSSPSAALSTNRSWWRPTRRFIDRFA